MRLLILTAIAFAGFVASAPACELQREVSNQPAVVAETEQDQTVAQQAPSKTEQPTQDQAKEESWPVLAVAAASNAVGE